MQYARLRYSGERPQGGVFPASALCRSGARSRLGAIDDRRMGAPLSARARSTGAAFRLRRGGRHRSRPAAPRHEPNCPVVSLVKNASTGGGRDRGDPEGVDVARGPVRCFRNTAAPTPNPDGSTPAGSLDRGKGELTPPAGWSRDLRCAAEGGGRGGAERGER